MYWAKRSFPAIATILLASSAAYGQAFEVASVKAAGTDCRGKGSVDSQQVRYSDFSLKGLVRDAYKFELYQINAPDWFGDQCYDVVAKLPEGAAKEQIPLMLQALLVERFHMKAHLETRQDRVYALVVGKNGPHLKESTGQREQPGGVKLRNDGHILFTSATLASFSSAMSVLMARPVVNMTDIQGHFDITLNVTREDLGGMNLPSDSTSADNPGNNASSSVFAAMQELGLNLVSRRAPIQHVVVDSAEKVPTGN
jgi:uncharacterized protein (TIGR03435 family)